MHKPSLSSISSSVLLPGNSNLAAEQAGIDWVHIDDDGQFIPNITIGPLWQPPQDQLTSLVLL
jgi:pentose-5-phosphate-3-epimerase